MKRTAGDTEDRRSALAGGEHDRIEVYVLVVKRDTADCVGRQWPRTTDRLNSHIASARIVFSAGLPLGTQDEMGASLSL